MNWYITGDCHGDFSRFENLDLEKENTAFIILGDVGLNFYLNKTDLKNKKFLESLGYYFICIRGNHEERPSVLNYPKVWKDEINGWAYIEDDFPHIWYLDDGGGSYNFGGYKCLVLPGAFSVDKNYRLARAARAGGRSWSGWFEKEQLSTEEMAQIEEKYISENFDFILSHTGPLNYEPRDVFLDFINQSSVDKTMEEWMEKLHDSMHYKIWLWGHYHVDRLEAPYHEIFFKNIELLDDIYNRWKDYALYRSAPWWIRKSPLFYVHEETEHGRLQHFWFNSYSD